MFSNTVPLLASVPAGSPADKALKAQLEALHEQADAPTRRLIEDIAKGQATLVDLMQTPWLAARLEAATKDGALFAAVSRQVDRIEAERVDVMPYLLKPRDPGSGGAR